MKRGDIVRILVKDGYTRIPEKCPDIGKIIFAEKESFIVEALPGDKDKYTYAYWRDELELVE
jgi:hypothetical protein